MKQLVSLLVMVCTIGLTAVFAQSNTETIVIKTAIYCDHSLQCESSAPNINQSVRRKVKGIRRVKVDPEANTITVTYRKDKATPDEIRQAISATGFDADQLKALTEAYEKLDACCKA
ncbi:MAG TPA: heavy metal-associated domain-containing protein [Parapedobacter sp.]|uniref:heavy-metal-associated domain-containing protein n=1 Tax=Parapedobacter sp. TaxID=1958893 RepID=UPI002C7526B0|nr:heavy metal-associated domain-containing protein [Parapedobacter sp.]HWK55769.1 heavy metal-associated domain-containing protein [Parapedobacter sp.]